ncbi:MAG TPA: multicopper oxidase domain-containing protein [Methylocella sp.]|nr:multicopper oxidase domain-containing protein [Methylocella sp.]
MAAGTAFGTRVVPVFVNKTAKPDPMHFHGHVFEAGAIGGRRYGTGLTLITPAAISPAWQSRV